MSQGIFISAGEASGEHYGALLTAELGRLLRGAGQKPQFFGMGGERMEAAGLERIVHAEDMAVMGFTEVVRHLPRIWGEFQKLKRAIRARRPGVAILIDFPEIHLRLARLFHELGIPVIYFVSPQLWAWKQHRIKLVQKYVRRMAVIFPFEEEFYRRNGVEAEFVGHPLAELPLPFVSRERFAEDNHLNPDCTWIGLLPGSRPREIRDHLPELIEAAWNLSVPIGAQAFPPAKPASPAKPEILEKPEPLAKPESPEKPELLEKFEFLVPLAPTLNARQRAEVLALAEEHGGGLALHLVDDARATLHHARASVVASGTATVEAALIGNPFVVVYRVSPLTYAIAKRMVKVEHVAMANLIAGRRVVPELIQMEFSAANIVQQISRLLPDEEPRQSMVKELAEVGERLRASKAQAHDEVPGAIERVAFMALEELGLPVPDATASGWA
jgi:lipid-A-disaccharide synthase